MSYTNINLVKKHVEFSDLPVVRQKNYSVEFLTDDWIDLPGRNLEKESITVKTIAGIAPYREEITIGNDPNSLVYKNLAPNSIAVASNNSLSTIYGENVDYGIDYSNGAIVRLPNGNIPDGTKVTVWYYYYKTYTENEDFQINYQDGKIKRVLTGSIIRNQTVLVDYELSINQLADEIISQAVSEANAIVEKSVDPEGRFGADSTLQTAASYLAVSLICRMAAVSDLKHGYFDSHTAKSWIVLADSYRSDYEQLLKLFRPPAGRLNKPTIS